MKKVLVLVLFFLTICAVSFAGGVQENETGKIVLDYWAVLNPKAAQYYTTANDMPVIKMLESTGNIDINFIHPVYEQRVQQFQTMLISGDLPDMIQFDWTKYYSGGPSAAINDGYIIPLNEYIDEYMPNLKKVMEDNPRLVKEMTTDDGIIYAIPYISGNTFFTSSIGPVIRKDILDKTGIEKVPETIDEWYEFLTRAKNLESGGVTIESPFCTVFDYVKWSNIFMGAYNVGYGMYRDALDGGKVKFGPIEKGYYDFLEEFSKWYAEGLVDKDLFSLTREDFDSKNMLGKSASFVGYSGTHVQKYAIQWDQEGKEFELIEAKYPVLEEGQVCQLGKQDFVYNPSYSVAITTANKNIPETLAWLDYFYSEEGRELCNWGIEGGAFVVGDNGEKQKTEEVKNDGNALYKYAPFDLFPNEIDPVSTVLDVPDIVTETRKAWFETNALNTQIPPVSYTLEEANELANIMNDVNLYVDEMFAKFIMGLEPLEKYDAFVEQLKKMNIDRAIEITQAAVDRFDER